MKLSEYLREGQDYVASKEELVQTIQDAKDNIANAKRGNRMAKVRSYEVILKDAEAKLAKLATQ